MFAYVDPLVFAYHETFTSTPPDVCHLITNPPDDVPATVQPTADVVDAA